MGRLSTAPSGIVLKLNVYIPINRYPRSTVRFVTLTPLSFFFLHSAFNSRSSSTPVLIIISPMMERSPSKTQLLARLSALELELKRKINDATRRSTKTAASDSVPTEASVDTVRKRKTSNIVDMSVQNSSSRPQKKFRWIATVSDKGVESRKSTKIQENCPTTPEAPLKPAGASVIANIPPKAPRNSALIGDRAEPVVLRKAFETNVALSTVATWSNHNGKTATIAKDSAHNSKRSARHRKKECHSWKKQNNDFAYVPTSTNNYCMFFNKFGKCRSGTSW